MMGGPQPQQAGTAPPPQQAAPTMATAPDSYELIQPKAKEELPVDPILEEIAKPPTALEKDIAKRRADISQELKDTNSRISSMQQVLNEVQENGKVDSAAAMLSFKHMKGRVDQYMKKNPDADYGKVFQDHLNELRDNFGKHPDNGRPLYPDVDTSGLGYDQRDYRSTI